MASRHFKGKTTMWHYLAKYWGASVTKNSDIYSRQSKKLWLHCWEHSIAKSSHSRLRTLLWLWLRMYCLEMVTWKAGSGRRSSRRCTMKKINNCLKSSCSKKCNRRWKARVQKFQPEAQSGQSRQLAREEKSIGVKFHNQLMTRQNSSSMSSSNVC